MKGFFLLNKDLRFFIMNSIFLFSLLLVNSNKILLLFALAYLIILIKKTQNYQFSLFIMFFNFLPFIVGRNLIETTLINRREMFGFSIFDIQYYFAIYLSDLFLFLIYQNYFSKKVFKNENQSKDKKINKNFKITLISLILFLILIASRSFNHQFAYLLFFGSLIIVKFILIFALPIAIDFKKYQKFFYQAIGSSVFFQTILVSIEQFKGGNIGKFIENSLPGLEIGTPSSESVDLLRANGTFNEPNIAAIFLLMHIVLLNNLAIKLILKNKKLSYFYLSINLLASIAIIFTGSRSLYALSIIYLFFFFLKNKKILIKFLNKLWKNYFLKLFVLIVLIIVLPYLLSRMSSLSNIFTDTGSLSYRNELNKQVFLMSLKNPLGIGIDLTPYYLAKNFKIVSSLPVIFDPAPAHNILIQILAEAGFLAFLVFVFLVYYSLKNGLETKNQRFAMAALAYFIAAQFHPAFTNHYELSAFFFLYLGIALYEKKQA